MRKSTRLRVLKLSCVVVKLSNGSTLACSELVVWSSASAITLVNSSRRSAASCTLQTGNTLTGGQSGREGAEQTKRQTGELAGQAGRWRGTKAAQSGYMPQMQCNSSGAAYVLVCVWLQQVERLHVSHQLAPFSNAKVYQRRLQKVRAGANLGCFS